MRHFSLKKGKHCRHIDFIKFSFTMLISISFLILLLPTLACILKAKEGNRSMVPTITQRSAERQKIQ